jgi:hypothetical protein
MVRVVDERWDRDHKERQQGEEEPEPEQAGE